MKISDAKVIVCCPGRNFVTLKLMTEDGVYGLGDATLNGSLIREVLTGRKSARRDVVILNSAAALVAAGRADHLRDAVPPAAEAIDSGAAAATLGALVAFTKAS